MAAMGLVGFRAAQRRPAAAEVNPASRRMAVAMLRMAEFWGRLEYHLCEEFQGFEDNQLRWYWCGGLIPERYDRHGRQWHISGRAWIQTQNKPECGQRRDSRQEPWTFTLIARHAADWDAINWDQLPPAAG
jgi:hypothetical protein